MLRIVLWAAAAVALLCGPGRAASPVVDVMGYVGTHPDADFSHKLRVRPTSAWGKVKVAIVSGIPNAIAIPFTVPAHARFRVGIALADQFFNKDLVPGTEPVRFTVVLAFADGHRETVLERLVDPRGRVRDRRWIDLEADLARFAGQEVTLMLGTEVAADSKIVSTTFALWQHPVVYDAEREAARPNLLFITIDALRADHLSAYGYPRPTSPRLDRLAAEGIRFANAFTSAPMTLPSMAQIFTSTYFPRFDSPNLMSALAAGTALQTKAIATNVYLQHWLILQTRDGFDSLTPVGSWRVDGIVRRTLEWLDWRKPGPFALFLHVLDTHVPYRPPGEYNTMFADPEYHGRVGDEFTDRVGAQAGEYNADDQARIVSLYDGGLRFVDTELGALFDGLEKRGLLDRTMIVISADHGEELWDHGSFFHGQSLYDELLHVPLIMRLPGRAHAGTVVTTPVRSVDIVPTITEVLDLPALPGFLGKSLLPLAGSSEPPEGRTVFARAANPNYPYRLAVRTPGHKLILTIGSGQRELYDLVKDPGEKHDLIADPGAASARATLDELLGQYREPLRRTGFQLRAVAHDGAEHDAEVVVTSTKELTLDNPERLDLPPADRIALTEEATTLTWTGRVGARASGFRFDRGFANSDIDPGLSFDVRVDGDRVPASAIRLGDGDAHPTEVPFTYRKFQLKLFTDPKETLRFTTSAEPDLAAHGSEAVTVYVWRSADAAATAVATPPADDETRRRLRALGYVE